MSSPPDNLRIARSIWESVRGVNVAALDWDSDAVRELIGAHYSPQIELEHFATGLETRVYRGLDGGFQWLREWFEPFSEYFVEALDFIVEGNCVVVPSRQWGVGRASGARVELEITWVYEFGDGQIVRITDHDTVEEGLARARGGGP
jgi:ketosteroid isomerase-like protein